MGKTASRYELLPSFLLGFHGTDEATAEMVFAGEAHLASSKNDYDWLGHGLRPYDTVRGAFWEGGPIYPDARIEKKNHVQICVRNEASIIGYFRPILD